MSAHIQLSLSYQFLLNSRMKMKDCNLNNFGIFFIKWLRNKITKAIFIFKKYPALGNIWNTKLK